MTFMTHFSETEQPLDNYINGKESASNLTGAFFPSSINVPCAGWKREHRHARLGVGGPNAQGNDYGTRFSVMV